MIARRSEQYLRHWFDKKRRKPLVLRGARQVGKSTLVRQFAEHHGLVLNEINLEKHLLLDDVFKSLDIKRIVLELEGLLGRNILSGGSLLFLDEVQATPHALAALRYFHEELPELPVIAAGSLLEFALARHSFSMPVGRVDYHHICPVTFSEFIACLEPDLNPWREAAARFEEIPGTAHQRLLARLREYLFVGGMPEAVMEFLESGSLSEVQEIQRSIVETYQDDFSKYAQHAELVRLQRIFGQIPRNIGRKIKYVNLSRE
ncbi:MAG: AAA+ family ATPase, partial [Verrucomicrobia bacterium]